MEYWWEAGALITVPFLHEPRQISERGSCGLRSHLTRRFSSCRTAGAGSGDRKEGINIMPNYQFMWKDPNKTQYESRVVRSLRLTPRPVYIALFKLDREG